MSRINTSFKRFDYFHLQFGNADDQIESAKAGREYKSGQISLEADFVGVIMVHDGSAGQCAQTEADSAKYSLTAVFVLISLS